MKRRVLQADVYDTLEIAALFFGGMGGGAHAGPWCILGYLDEVTEPGPDRLEFTAALMRAFDVVEDVSLATPNDSVFTEREMEDCMRLPWPEYCRRLNIVRAA